MEAKLKALKSVLEAGALTKADKAYIKKTHKELIGSELVTKSGCSNCWMDGLIVMLNTFKKNKITMRAGDIVECDGTWYNRHTITDSIARKIIAQNPELQTKFINI